MPAERDVARHALGVEADRRLEHLLVLLDDAEQGDTRAGDQGSHVHERIDVGVDACVEHAEFPEVGKAIRLVGGQSRCHPAGHDTWGQRLRCWIWARVGQD